MSNLNEINKEEINIYITSEREKNSSLKYLFKEAIAIKNLLSGDIDLSKEYFNDLSNDTNAPREIAIRASKFLDTLK
jgi:hypothetical protein